MNLANRLTIFRIILVPLFLVFLSGKNPALYLAALVIFLVAMLTDIYDGWLARRYNMVTNLGIFLDPLADKLLVATAFICFVAEPRLDIPAWMVVIIIARDFLITGLRLVAAEKNIVIAASRLGKFKTTTEVVAIIGILVLLLSPEYWIRIFGVSFVRRFSFWLTLLAAASSLFSGLIYWKKFSYIIREK